MRNLSLCNRINIPDFLLLCYMFLFYDIVNVNKLAILMISMRTGRRRRRPDRR